MKRALEPAISEPGSGSRKRQQLTNVPSSSSIFHRVSQLDHQTLYSLIEFAQDLIRKQTVQLPADIWKHIFQHLNTKSSHTFASSSVFFEALNTLYTLRVVSNSWKKMAEEVLRDLRTSPSRRPDPPHLKKALYLSAICGSLQIFNYLRPIIPRYEDVCLLFSAFFGMDNFFQTIFPLPEIAPNVALRPIFALADTGNNRLMSTMLGDPRVQPHLDNHNTFVIACKGGHLETVKLLLADPRIVAGTQSNKPFRLACTYGHFDVVELLLSHPNITPNTNNDEAFRAAANYGHTKIVQLLLNDPRISPQADNNLAIRMASKNGHLDVVRLLLADPRVSPDADEDIAFISACQGGRLNVVQALLEDPRVNPNSRNNQAIRVACQNRHWEIAKLLCADDRVSPEAENSWCLQMASRFGSLETVEILLKNHLVDPTAANNYPLQIAILNRHLKIAERLLEIPEVQNYPSNKYLLFCALQSQYVDAFKLLIKYPFIDLTIHNNYALRTALACNHNISSFLINALQYNAEVQDSTQMGLQLKPGSLLPLITPGQVHANWSLGPMLVLPPFPVPIVPRDAFGIKQTGLTELQIATKWAELLGLGPPISWECRREGIQGFVVFVPSLESSSSEMGVEPLWTCEPHNPNDESHPIIFSLVCERAFPPSQFHLLL